MDPTEIERIELDLLLDAVYQRHGYDFRAYARASVERRVRQFMARSNLAFIAEIIPKALHDEAFFADMVKAMSVPTTEMFRDPEVFVALRQHVLPLLRTWPHFKVWHAGCATGEEVYSLAIMLAEAELIERSTIYATDINDASLSKAKDGSYRLDRVGAFAEAHRRAGGAEPFSNYYDVHGKSAVMSKRLKQHMTFANHNLAVDRAFGEMHLILCRNVLIYFKPELQNRVLKMYAESLVNGGFLCLGPQEDLRFSDVASRFVELEPRLRIYKEAGR